MSMSRLSMSRRFYLIVALFAGASVVAIAPVNAQQTTRLCDGLEVTLLGTPGDDELTGTSGPDVIAGLQGNDVIRGLGGEDVICAGIGDDTVFGGAGFDIIFGAQGDDVIYASSGSDKELRADNRGARMFGGAGNDIIHGTNRWDRMQGGAGNDMLYGYEGRDWMRAGANNDVVDGGPGIDDLHGGNGKDKILLTDQDTVRGGAGADDCNINVGEPNFIVSCELTKAFERAPAIGESAAPGDFTTTVTTCSSTTLATVPSVVAGGLITNNTGQLQTPIIRVHIYDAAGVQFGEAFRFLGVLPAGETSRWTAEGFDIEGNAASCRIQIELESLPPSQMPSPGSEFNARLRSCFVSDSGLTATGQITNTLRAAEVPEDLAGPDFRVLVFGYDNQGVRYEFPADGELSSFEFNPGDVSDFTTFGGPQVTNGISRCEIYVGFATA